MSDERNARDERRRKIRALEASLFGESTADAFKVDVPQLKNVDEYFDKFGKAERQRRTQPTNPESHLTTTLKTSFSTITSRTTKRSNDKNGGDTSHLLSDDEDDDDDVNEDNYKVGKSFGKVAEALHLLRPLFKLGHFGLFFFSITFYATNS